jgi:hypothetical protein
MAEAAERDRQEKAKEEFLQRIVSEQVTRARVIHKIREQKEKSHQQQEELVRLERESTRSELRLMFREDTRLTENLEKQRKRIAENAQKFLSHQSNRPESASRRGANGVPLRPITADKRKPSIGVVSGEAGVDNHETAADHNSVTSKKSGVPRQIYAPKPIILPTKEEVEEMERAKENERLEKIAIQVCTF